VRLRVAWRKAGDKSRPTCEDAAPQQLQVTVIDERSSQAQKTVPEGRKMAISIKNLLKRPFCEHVFHHSRSKPGFLVCVRCRLYRRA
jgi:hypothetical protein